MAFEIQDVSEAEFPVVVRDMWRTYEAPLQHLFRIFCPLNAVGATDREGAIRESTARLREWDASDPSSRWQKVVETASGRIVGAALWKINRTDPYAEPHADEEEAYWHPEGGQREYANQVLERHEEARARWARRPHLYLNIIYTLPEYQRRGVGGLIMEWGIAKAAELDVEMWLNAWRYGRRLYEKHGFVTVKHYKTRPKTEHPDDAWKACARDWDDLEEWVMWRPKDGPYVEGKSIKPWEAS